MFNPFIKEVLLHILTAVAIVCLVAAVLFYALFLITVAGLIP